MNQQIKLGPYSPGGMRAKNRKDRMQEQKNEGDTEAPKAVPYVLRYTRPPFPKPQPSLAPARHPLGLTMLRSLVLADVKKLSWQVSWGATGPSLACLLLWPRVWVPHSS